MTEQIQNTPINTHKKSLDCIPSNKMQPRSGADTQSRSHAQEVSVSKICRELAGAAGHVPAHRKDVHEPISHKTSA